MSDALSERVLSALATVKRIPRETISVDSSLQDLGVDSLDTILLACELEKEFQISIPDEEVRSIRNVRDVVEGVRKLADIVPINSVASAA